MMALADLSAELRDLVRRKLLDAPASSADHVVVWFFAEGVFVVSLFDVEPNLFEDSTIDEERNRPVNRSLAHLDPTFLQEVQNFLGFEVVTERNRGVKYLLACAGVLDPVRLQITTEDGVQLLVRMNSLYVFHGLPTVARRRIAFQRRDLIIQNDSHSGKDVAENFGYRGRKLSFHYRRRIQGRPLSFRRTGSRSRRSAVAYQAPHRAGLTDAARI